MKNYSEKMLRDLHALTSHYYEAMDARLREALFVVRVEAEKRPTHYRIAYDFDVHGEPPTVHIYNDETHVCEVDEYPTCQGGGAMDGDGEWVGPWSHNADDWQPGPIAAHILALLNTQPIPPDEG